MKNIHLKIAVSIMSSQSALPVAISCFHLLSNTEETVTFWTQHTNTWACAAWFERIYIVYKHRNDRIRTIIQAAQMAREQSAWISKPSNALVHKELEFLGRRRHGRRLWCRFTSLCASLVFPSCFVRFYATCLFFLITFSLVLVFLIALSPTCMKSLPW